MVLNYILVECPCFMTGLWNQVQAWSKIKHKQLAVINIVSFCIFINLTFNIHFQKWSEVTVKVYKNAETHNVYHCCLCFSFDKTKMAQEQVWLSMIQVQADMLIRRPRSSCRQGDSLEKKCEILEFLPSHLFYHPAPGAPDVAFSHSTNVKIWVNKSLPASNK